jgi:hypothetical protein
MEIKGHNDFIPEAALLSFQKGRLKEWTIEYLEGIGGNQELADIYKKVPVAWFIKEYPLKDLKRIVGPEEGMAYPEDKEKWETRTNELVEKIKQGEQIPPLIVSDDSGELTIADGNHRYEALLRSEIEEYYCIFTLVNNSDIS